MKKLIPALAVVAVVFLGEQYFGPHDVSSVASSAAQDAIASAFDDRRSGIEVTGKGTVTRILPDDRDGSPHQRFILMLASGQTLLVAHNIALADRIPAPSKGDAVEFKGQYEWNSQGGIIHWTHEDPDGRHEAGWLKHGGRTYH